jgi:hypothetical protein
MLLDVLPSLGVVLVVALTAFFVSAAIGLVLGRLTLDEPDDGWVAQPARRVRRPPG